MARIVRIIGGALTLAMAGCVSRPGAGGLNETPVSFDALPGWRQDHSAAVLPALLRDCARLAALPPETRLGGDPARAPRRGDEAGDWLPACAAAQAVPSDDRAVRRFFEARFRPYRLSDAGSTTALMTGYFEPLVRGSRVRGGIYQTPVYARPADLVRVDGTAFGKTPSLPGGAETLVGRVVGGKLEPVPDRARIEAGALAGQGLELLYLADPVDLFFLQIQGSGRVLLPDGGVVRLGYAGKNGQPYRPIGRLLADWGEIPTKKVTTATIRQWLASHPGQARAVMDENPNYVFFRPLTGLRDDQGAPGALGVPLTPGRSVAVDRRYIPLGAPVFVDGTDALTRGPQRFLAQADDMGGAIVGPLHVDLFYGNGSRAEQAAGTAQEKAVLYVLLPR